MRTQPSHRRWQLELAAGPLGLICLLIMTMGACATPRVAVPGHSSYAISKVTIQGTSISLGELPDKLGLRSGDMLKPGQNYNPFRAREDMRRIKAYFQTKGFLDASVAPPKLVRDEKKKRVAVHWKVTENTRYRVASLSIKAAPPGTKLALMAKVPFRKGELIDDLQAWRLNRVNLAEHLRDLGWAHAEVYSRIYVERAKHVIHWVYFVDSGPRTQVGKIEIIGNKRIPQKTILNRLGLKPGAPYSHRARLKAQLDLLDMGSFNVVRVHDNADNEFMIGKLPPDDGGKLKPSQVGPNGELIPRSLSSKIDLKVAVTEAPRVKGRLGLGAGLDTERLDGKISASSVFRDLFGAAHHLSLSGKVGYGWLFRESSDEPLGLYGQAALRYNHSGFIHRLLDLRLSAVFEQTWFPAFYTQNLTGGLGIQVAVATRTFFDFSVRYQGSTAVGLEHIDAKARKSLSLTTEDLSTLEVSTAFVWDKRDNRVEARKGHLLSLRASLGPGNGVGTHGYVKVGGDFRAYVPLPKYLALGFRVAGDWVFGLGDKGVPPAVRLFGGGAFGFRGVGLKRLSPLALNCPTPDSCIAKEVGGLSLVQATFDVRWLPFRKQMGANLFVDVAGSGPGANPFDEGVNVAVGIGARARLWYLPMSIDIAYRVAEVPALKDTGRFTAFFRIGEAF